MYLKCCVSTGWRKTQHDFMTPRLCNPTVTVAKDKKKKNCVVQSWYSVTQHCHFPPILKITFFNICYLPILIISTITLFLFAVFSEPEGPAPLYLHVWWRWRRQWRGLAGLRCDDAERLKFTGTHTGLNWEVGRPSGEEDEMHRKTFILMTDRPRSLELIPLSLHPWWQNYRGGPWKPADFNNCTNVLSYVAL